METKFCECCNKHISYTNYASHRKTNKHQKNKLKYKPINLLDGVKPAEATLNTVKTQLENIKNDLENIISNL